MTNKIKWRPDEPARDPDYRRAYAKMHERIVNQDSCITYLLIELRAVQKRLAKLEKYNEITSYAKLRTARHMAEIHELEQRGDLPAGQAGDPEAGRPPATTGL